MAAATEFFEITPRNWRARLAISVDMMRELSRYTDPDELYHVFARRMQQLYPTARQMTLSRRGLDSPEFRVTRFNLWKDRVNPYKDQQKLPLFTGGLLADLVYGDQPCVIDDLLIPSDDPAADFLDGQQSLLAIPVFEHGTATSMIVVTREEPAAFPREQVPELVWMTNLFGRAMQTLVLSEQLRAAYDAADYELRSIAELQHSLLPAEVPKIAGLDVAVHYRTANQAGGDYYDFFPLPGGRLALLVADVSGHDTTAAVLMAITHTLTHSFTEPLNNPGRLLAYLNDHLAKRYTVTSGSFVTAFCAVFDPQTSTVTCANAGHIAPRIAAGEKWEPFPTDQGLPLGVNPRSASYPEQVVPFAEGARLAVFTDGVPETVNRNGEPFGLTRLAASLGGPTAVADEVVRSVIQQLDNFAAGLDPADDRTLVVVQRG